MSIIQYVSGSYQNRSFSWMFIRIVSNSKCFFNRERTYLGFECWKSKTSWNTIFLGINTSSSNFKRPYQFLTTKSTI